MLFRLIIAVCDRKASIGILFYLLGFYAKLWFKAQMRFKVICIL